MSVKTVYFKNSSSGKKLELELDIDMPLSSIREAIDKKIVTDLDVHENYKIIKARQQLLEHDSNIDEKSEMPIRQLFYDSPYFISFYITPLSFSSMITQNSCYICYNTILRNNFNFACGHDKSICLQCVGTWSENCKSHSRLSTCPICRAEI